MKYICDSCEKYPCDDTEIKLMKYCPVYSLKPKPITNADRIRAMTDEELAVLLSNTEANFPPNYPNGVSVKLCKTSWLDWLKKEVDE